MAVAGQQITVKVGPLKESKGQLRHRGERRGDGGKEEGGPEGGARWVGKRRNRSATTTRPLHKRYAACRRYADTFILAVMR